MLKGNPQSPSNARKNILDNMRLGTTKQGTQFLSIFGQADCVPWSVAFEKSQKRFSHNNRLSNSSDNKHGTNPSLKLPHLNQYTEFW